MIVKCSTRMLQDQINKDTSLLGAKDYVVLVIVCLRVPFFQLFSLFKFLHFPVLFSIRIFEDWNFQSYPDLVTATTSLPDFWYSCNLKQLVVCLSNVRNIFPAPN